MCLGLVEMKKDLTVLKTRSEVLAVLGMKKNLMISNKRSECGRG